MSDDDLQCAHIGCTNTGGSFPCLLLYLRDDRSVPPIEMIITMPVCWQHQIGCEPKDFMTRNQWERILERLAAAGTMLPHWPATKLKWIPIDQFDAETYALNRPEPVYKISMDYDLDDA